MRKIGTIQSVILTGMAILGVSVPLRVSAAGQDTVHLQESGSKVAVSLEMSNASEEKITTVAVSLEIEAQKRDQVEVGFSFSSEVSGAESSFVYQKDTGRLDIYVVSAKCLFNEDSLNLGEVQLSTLSPDQLVTVDVGYCPDSFQTANGSYGSKTPVVEGEIAPVRIQVGNSVSEPSGPDSGSTGSGNTGNANHGSGQSGSGQKDNLSQGLYDTDTRFVNDPSNAQRIPSPIIGNDKAGVTLIDMSAKAAEAIRNILAGMGSGGTGGLPTGPGSTATGNKGAPGQTLESGKVSVVAPEKGPESLLVSKNESGQTDGRETEDGFVDKTAGENDDQATSGGSAEIMLDRENGGAVKAQRKEKQSYIVMTLGVLGIVALAGGMAIFFFTRKTGRSEANARRKRRQRRKRRAGTVRTHKKTHKRK